MAAQQFVEARGVDVEGVVAALEEAGEELDRALRVIRAGYCCVGVVSVERHPSSVESSVSPMLRDWRLQRILAAVPQEETPRRAQCNRLPGSRMLASLGAGDHARRHRPETVPPTSPVCPVGFEGVFRGPT